MNRRQLFISTAKTALASAFGWSWLPASVRAQEVLPQPEPPFKGTIGRTYKDSVPDKIPIIKAPDGAPNVLLVLIDDCGFGQWGTFGGQIPTPNLDRLAKAGLRYTRFHTTALCSPTRAALLTGRNHHSAATGNITELGDGYPGYSGKSRPTPPWYPRCCGSTATARRGSARTITSLIGKPAYRDLTTAGRRGRGLTISTALLAAKRTNGHRQFIATTRPSRWKSPRVERLITRSTKRSPMRQSNTSTNKSR